MPEELMYEKSCGAVVYCKKDNDIKYLLVCEHGGFYFCTYFDLLVIRK